MLEKNDEKKGWYKKGWKMWLSLPYRHISEEKTPHIKIPDEKGNEAVFVRIYCLRSCFKIIFLKIRIQE